MASTVSVVPNDKSQYEGDNPALFYLKLGKKDLTSFAKMIAYLNDHELESDNIATTLARILTNGQDAFLNSFIFMRDTYQDHSGEDIGIMLNTGYSKLNGGLQGRIGGALLDAGYPPAKLAKLQPKPKAKPKAKKAAPKPVPLPKTGSKLNPEPMLKLLQEIRNELRYLNTRLGK